MKDDGMKRHTTQGGDELESGYAGLIISILLCDNCDDDWKEGTGRAAVAPKKWLSFGDMAANPYPFPFYVFPLACRSSFKIASALGNGLFPMFRSEPLSEQSLMHRRLVLG